jgi:ABC-type branched-subunit amino acid transport system permease subunit
MSDLKPTFGSLVGQWGDPQGRSANVKRLLACLLGGVVLALMVGSQQGTQGGDFHIAFREAWFRPRIAIFLIIGVAVYLLITLWPLVVPYVERPGMRPLGAGLITVVIAQTVLNWYDPVANQNNGNGRFAKLGDVLSNTNGLGAVTGPFFSWLGWTLLAVSIVLTGIAVAGRRPIAGYVSAVVGLAGAVIAYLAHDDVTGFNQQGQSDHSFGVYVDMIGFLILAGAGLVAARSELEVADSKAFFARVNGFRPGLVAMVIALLWGLAGFVTAGWFGASGASVNWTLADASSNFKGTGVGPLATQYLSWLGWVLFLACIVLGAAAAWLRNLVVAWVTAALALVSVILTFVVLKQMTETAARLAPQYGKSWQNLGTGGFVACMVFSLVGAAMAQTISAARVPRPSTATGESARFGNVSRAVESVRGSSSAKAVLVVGVAVALFYPPTLTVTWQNVLVTQIGVYVLLAIGLNVVVGWAGLLDLGYIAFYEIGSYTTAYLTGTLPVRPPHWLHWAHSPLWAIPLAIIVCLIAGVLLGAPTLRLRGDYLAIVTLGFGEIIQQVAVNAKGFTGGPVGPTVPHPKLDLGFLKVVWGQDNLPYWYLLLVMLAIVLVLFHRLENSRLGRAWAAIREDEVAAQATGVNTTRVKLLAFAIGASTSGLAGVFFASQVGYFDPTLFTLQASILIVAYVVFGGMGSLWGSMAGAAVLTWLPQFLKSQVPLEDRQMWVGALVLAMMIFRPAGLIPARRRRAELEGLDGTSSSETRAVPAGEGL